MTTGQAIASCVFILVCCAVSFVYAYRRLWRTERRKILRALCETPDYGVLGLAIVERAQVGRGTVYVHLAGMEEDGLLTSTIDPNGPVDPGWSKRRLYRITQAGIMELVEMERRR